MSGDRSDIKVCIRKMELQDVQAVREIDQISFSLPWPERSFAFEVSSNPASRPWVAEITRTNGSPQIAGMAVLWLVLDEAHIGTLAVHPDYRGLKIGQQLLAESLFHAYAEGVRQSYLEVRRSNLPAQKLYQKFGYTVVSIRSHYYRDNGEDAFLMTLESLNPDDLKKLFVYQDSSLSGGKT